ncbi:phosphoethanolamine transferase [Dyella sp. C9]|uniref:phosphoethanolamine transferase n=1 Tax=Dyella sp. C9 TaxID=2202154 RepID=UPI001300316A|nr:phosphoethanolamine transferase [Dyella sp. C9]
MEQGRGLSGAGFRRVLVHNSVFGLLLAILLLPSALVSFEAFICGLPAWLALLAVVNSRRAVAWLAIPLVLFLPAVLHYQHVAQMAPGESLWLILFNSSLAEVLEYLEPFALWLSVWAVISSALLWLAWRWMRGPIFSRQAIRWACVAPLLMQVATFPTWVASQQPMVATNWHFHMSYPWSLLTGYVQARIELAEFAQIERVVAASSKVKVNQLASGRGPRTIVLVIGESARRDRHGIYGYPVQTTPMAERTPGLVAFSNVISLHYHTVDAVPVILAKRRAWNTGSQDHPNLISSFASAGFRTFWISNQAAMGMDDSAVAAYASFADVQIFERPLSRFGLIAYDDVLLPRFFAALSGKADDRFIVLHLFGSHERFSQRYPSEFNEFPDSYDNSILYTDAILGQVMQSLSQMPGESAMVYLSDHGLKLGECDGLREHFDSKQAFEIPLYVWTSSSWQAAHPAQWAQAKANRDLPATTMNVFDTLMDLADLRYPQYDAGSSLLAAHPETSKRIVAGSFGLVDYDHASNNKQCHLVPNVDVRPRSTAP